MFFKHTSSGLRTEINPLSGETEVFFVRTLSKNQSSSDRLLVIRLDIHSLEYAINQLVQESNLQYVAMVVGEGDICTSAGQIGDTYITTLEELENSLDEQIYVTRHSSVWKADFCFVQDESEICCDA